VQLHISNDAAKVFTRRGNDWTKRFSKIAHDAFLINAASAIIDGEVVVPAADGTTDFSVLQNELRGKSTKIVMVAFDLLYLNGYDLRKLPLIVRKTHLKRLIEKTAIQFSDHFDVDGPEIFTQASKIGLEGVVSKVRDSKYNSGRGNDLVKKTCAQRETLTIAGFALDGNDWDGVYLGRRKGDDLIYAGKVDHGFDKLSAKLLRAADAADPENAAVCKKDRAKRDLGRTAAHGRNRISREVRGGKGAPPIFQRNSGGRMKPRDLATRSRNSKDRRRVDPDGFLRKTLTLPVDEARSKAREFLTGVPISRLHDHRRAMASASRR
jgi:ATP-dependent DNA ligase